MDIGDRIRELRKKRGLSVQALADYIGKDKTTVYKYEKNEIKGMPIDILPPMAKLLGTTPAYLLMGGDPYGVYPVGKIFKIPVLSTVKAGYGGIAQEESALEYESVSEDYLCGHVASECRIMVVRGNSMHPKIVDGDRVLVHLQSDVDSGDVAVVLVNGDEGTLKKVVKGENYIDLVPFNPEYETRRIEGVDLDEFWIFGKVINLMRRF